MKRFFLKLASLLAVAIGVVVISWVMKEREIASLGTINANVERARKLVALIRQVPDARVIFGGDSRAEKSIMPKIFATRGIPAINTATAAADLWGTVKAFELFGLHQREAIFIISASAFNIDDGANVKGVFSAEQFFDLTPWERLRMLKMSYFRESARLLKDADANAGILQASRFHGPVGFIHPELGFRFEDGAGPKCDRVRFGSSQSKNPWYRDVKLDGAKWRLFKEAVEKMRQWKGVGIIYNPPISPAYRKCIEGTYVDETERQYSKQLAEFINDPKSNGRVIFMDFYSDPLPALDDDSLYSDTHHFNSRGAALFTNIWMDSLIKLKLVTPK